MKPGDPSATQPFEDELSEAGRNNAHDDEDRRESQAEDHNREDTKNELSLGNRRKQDGEGAGIRKQAASNAQGEQHGQFRSHRREYF